MLTGLRLRGLFVHDYGDGARALLAARGVSVRTFYDFAPAVAGHIRELLLSDVAPSCIGYAVGEEGARPLFEPARLHYAAEFTLRSVQDAALAFVDGRRRHVQQRQDGVIRREAREEEPGRQCEGNDIDERGQPAGKAVLDELNERVCGATVAEKLRNGFSERARKGNGGGGSGCGFL